MLKIKNYLYPVLLIVITTILVGVVIGFYCDLFGYFDLMAKDRLLKNPLIYLVTTPILFWIAAYLCRKFSPYSSGNLLEHIKTALENSEDSQKNAKKIDKILNLRIVIVTFISSLILAFGSGALGREAPSVYMSASLFASVGQKFRNLTEKISLQSWIFAGSGVGLAIAFNAPIAGLAYVVEKLIRSKKYDFRGNLLWSILALTIFVFFFQKIDPVFLVIELDFKFSNNEIFAIILVSLVCAIFAFAFKKINFYIHNKLIFIKSTRLWHLVPITAGILVAIISFYSGIYSFSGGIKTANDALAHQDILLSYKEVVGRIFNTFFSFSSGAAGGIVAPSITIGAGIASIIGSFIDVVDLKILMLVGMVSFLAIVLGEPITAAILIYESCHQSLSSLPFLIFASLISVSIIRLIKK